jgi:Tfp pilus assembly protein PilO
MKPEQKKNLILFAFLGVLGVAGCAVYYFMLVKPELAEQKKAAADAVKEYEGYVEDNKKITEFQKKYESPEYQEIKKSVLELEKRLPSTQQADQFFNALTDAILVTDVTNTSLQKQPILDRRSVRYEEIPYKLAMKSRFHQFGQFLNIIEQNPERFMRVKSMTIGNDKVDPTLHPIDIQIATFRFISR